MCSMSSSLNVYSNNLITLFLNQSYKMIVFFVMVFFLIIFLSLQAGLYNGTVALYNARSTAHESVLDSRYY